jgi:hypothetical protein
MLEKISRYTSAIVLSLLGLVLLYFGLVSGQNFYFIIGASAIILVGIVTAVNAAELLNNSSSRIISAVLVIFSLALSAWNYKSIKDPLDFAKERDYKYQFVIQRLKDLREVQLGYKNANGYYTADLDSLVNFIKNDSLKIVKAIGSVPDTLTEAQALQLGLISRDTVKVSASEYIFNDKYVSERKIGKLFIDSLPFVPFTQARFDLQIGTVSRGKIKVQVFQIRDGEPFDPLKVLQVGSLTDVSTAGNWGE